MLIHTLRAHGSQAAKEAEAMPMQAEETLRLANLARELAALREALLQAEHI